jgi:hypothetical protein
LNSNKANEPDAQGCAGYLRALAFCKRYPMNTVFRADLRTFEVIPVLCENIGYPHRDVNGDIMYENSHFLTEEDAWTQVFVEADSWRELATRRVVEAQHKLQHVKDECVNASVMFQSVKERYGAWKANNGVNADPEGRA